MGNQEAKRIISSHVAGTSSNVSELGGRLHHCVKWMRTDDKESVNELVALLDKGAPVNFVSVDEVTALHIACKRGLINAVNELLNHGADIQANNTWLADTPLHIAAAVGNKEVVELLLQRNAQPNALNSFGATPLHSAAVGGFPDVVEVLISNGGELSVVASKDPYFCGFQPLRPLAFAVRRGDVACIISFLIHGDSFADFDPKSLMTKLVSRHVPWGLIEMFVLAGLKLTSEILDLDEDSTPPEFLRSLVEGPKSLEQCCLQQIRTLLHGKDWSKVIQVLPISEFHREKLMYKNYLRIASNLYST